MFSYIVISFLILGFTDSEHSLRKKREVDPEVFMNISEVIQYQGYANEEYEILTDDGYYLPINRIPYGRKKSEHTASKPVVIVVPGVLTNGGSWVVNTPNNSLGFVLADAGFDVWLANNRGCRWCRRHQKFSIDEEEFWNFSFHEMGMHDLPAIIHFVLAKTGQEKIFYIGHSQGSAIAFIAFSAFPQLAQKIKVFFALGPVAFLNHSKSPYLKFAYLADNMGKIAFRGIWYHKPLDNIPSSVAKFTGNTHLHLEDDHVPGSLHKMWFTFKTRHILLCTCFTKKLLSQGKLIDVAENKALLGKKEFCVLHNNTRAFIAKICDKNFWNIICAKLLFSAGGISKNNLNMSRIDVIASHLPGCTSTKNLLHWAQVRINGAFKTFDYGSENVKKYNQATPPAYNIKGMDVPIAVWSGSSDIMATLEDTKLLLPLLRNLIYYKEIPHWMHYDFIFGLDAQQELYGELVKIIQNFP